MAKCCIVASSASLRGISPRLPAQMAAVASASNLSTGNLLEKEIAFEKVGAIRQIKRALTALKQGNDDAINQDHLHCFICSHCHAHACGQHYDMYRKVRSCFKHRKSICVPSRLQTFLGVWQAAQFAQRAEACKTIFKELFWILRQNTWDMSFWL
ncbi:uncharacterized protein LOC142575987 [Dermacentor variabilis]|uniref:uncharacterized protein LOC142575987 n=1 Tax=Dermacentor variabilis TaxID=34621 RepID=UPI003F5C815B